MCVHVMGGGGGTFFCMVVRACACAHMNETTHINKLVSLSLSLFTNFFITNGHKSKTDKRQQ